MIRIGSLVARYELIVHDRGHQAVLRQAHPYPSLGIAGKGTVDADIHVLLTPPGAQYDAT